MKNRLLFAECNLKCTVLILILIIHTACYRNKMTISDMTLSTWLAFCPRAWKVDLSCLAKGI